MSKYAYKDFQFTIYTNWFYLLPSIELHRMYIIHCSPQTIEIQIHFLMLHARWLWRREQGGYNDQI